MALSAALTLFTPAGALAQAQVFGQCDTQVTPMAATQFDNAEHRAWYMRFWTGKCAGTHGFCMSGSPNWNGTIDYVTKHAPPADRAALVNRACRLGQVIGLEWARDRRSKRITIKDLRDFDAILKRNPDLSTAMGKISQRVTSLLAAPRTASS